jgi:2-isopropylmalate synthase
VHSGINITAAAVVKLKVAGELICESAIGNGPIDAVYQSIYKIAAYDVVLKEYKITAKSEGKDALGQVDVMVGFKGKLYHGMGLSTDIIESSARALVHALNYIYQAQLVERKRKNRLSTLRTRAWWRNYSEEIHASDYNRRRALCPGT